MKKFATLLLTLILCITLFSGCAAREDGEVDYGPFIAVDSENSSGYYDGLVYHKDTLVLYIYIDGHYRLTITPYISEKGNLCRYIDGTIKEIK